MLDRSPSTLSRGASFAITPIALGTRRVKPSAHASSSHSLSAQTQTAAGGASCSTWWFIRCENAFLLSKLSATSTLWNFRTLKSHASVARQSITPFIRCHQASFVRNLSSVCDKENRSARALWWSCAASELLFPPRRSIVAVCP